jgi:serine/threonine-protein kinase RsbT
MNNVLNPSTGAAEPVRAVQLQIGSQAEVLSARQHGREFAMKIGFTGSDVTLIAAAICEIARNMVDYAQRGEMSFSLVERDGRRGMLIMARDEGPGIPDVDQALRYGCSTRKGLGVGLPGAKWLMDEFQLNSQPGCGTTVKMIKWQGH